MGPYDEQFQKISKEVSKANSELRGLRGAEKDFKKEVQAIFNSRSTNLIQGLSSLYKLEPQKITSVSVFNEIIRELEELGNFCKLHTNKLQSVLIGGRVTLNN